MIESTQSHLIRPPTRASREWIVLATAAVAFGALRLPCVHIALERDEGEYAYIAQRMLAGELPYRDAFDQKPPGVFLLYLLPVALFGTSVAAIHWMLYAWTGLTIAALYALARRLAGRSAAAWAVLAFTLLTIEPSWLATAANTEQFMLLPMTLAALFALRAATESRRRDWFAAGAALMAAVWFKQVALVNVALLAGMSCWGRGREPRGHRLRGVLLDGLATLGGAAAVAAPVCLFLMARGAWPAFVDAVWTHTLRYTTRVPLEAGWILLKEALTAQAGSLWLVCVLTVVGIAMHWRIQRPVAAFLLGWLVLSCVGVSAGLYFRAHYFLQLAPVLSLACGVALMHVARRLRPRTHLVAAIATMMLCVVFVAPMMTAHARFFFDLTPAEKGHALYGGNPFAESAEIAACVAALARPSERVLIYGSEPQILFLAQRRSATRYIIFNPLMMVAPDAEARQREAWEELVQAPPACILMTEMKTSNMEAPGSPKLLRRNVVERLLPNYELVALRRSDVGPPRILYYAEARDAYEDAEKLGERDRVDMFVLARRP